MVYTNKYKKHCLSNYYGSYSVNKSMRMAEKAFYYSTHSSHQFTP